MLAAFSAKLETYFIVGAVALVAALGWGWHEHHAGYKEATADAQVALEKANEKTEKLQARLDKSSEERANELDRITTQHNQDLVAAMGSVKPVLVRVPADRSEVPQTSGTPGTSNPAPFGQTDSALSASIDIAPALVVFAGEYQACRDSLSSWQSWYASQVAIAGW